MDFGTLTVHGFAHAAFGELSGGPPGDPFLRVARLREVVGLAFAGKLFGVRTRHGWLAG